MRSEEARGLGASLGPGIIEFVSDHLCYWKHFPVSGGLVRGRRGLRSYIRTEDGSCEGEEHHRRATFDTLIGVRFVMGVLNPLKRLR